MPDRAAFSGPLHFLPSLVYLRSLEKCRLGLYETVFSSAIVEPMDQRTQAITPAVLGIAGRELGRTGNAIFRTDIQVGRDLELIPATSFVVRGSAHPRDWRYSVSLNGPTETRFQENVEADGIIHFRLRASAYAPWLGRSVLSLGSATSKMASKIETALTREQSIRPARMIHTDLLSEELQTFIQDLVRGRVRRHGRQRRSDDLAEHATASQDRTRTGYSGGQLAL